MASESLIQKKRFHNEELMMKTEPLGYATAYSDKENPLIWYALFKGQKGSDYLGGEYILKIHHSPKYPAEPPSYYMLTPSGRFDVDKEICLTNSRYHKGEWTSTWNIKTILIAFYSIFLDDIEHGISHIKDTKENRVRMAIESIDYNKKNRKEIYENFNFDHIKIFD